ncbi:CoF synthetase [Scopulibacillus cellulosilyticus]|uniref:CoF synthetase n=1 Tax=Scopulibacillus cellulosilyticus TaxID=2665665 RepID=A0ABW2Q2B5_9BACL
MRKESKEITEQILTFIEESNEEESRFNELALKLFTYQFKFNLPYKKFCQKRRKTPLTVKNWREIPVIPIQAFKELVLSCEPAEEAEAVFMTSGTTNAEKRGKNHHPSLQVWDASMMTGFKQFVVPDGKKRAIFVLSPGEDLNKNSSLSRYLTMAVKHFGNENSRNFFNKDGLDMNSLVKALKESEERKEPVMLMGASFAYVHFLDYCKEHGNRFKLASGSRLFDTGGFKGQSREVKKEELYLSFEETFAISQKDCINMYGMTELSSQIYDQKFVFRDRLNTKMSSASWLKTLVLHPETLEPLKDGEIGILAHYDLANWNSCLAILTEDMGYKTADGLTLLGRAEGSEARGCSISVDQLMEAQQQ